MPGENCAFPGCGSCRRHKGLSLFYIPMRKDDFYEKWRENILNVLKKYRGMDANFSTLIQRGHIFICEKHFATDDIELTSKFCLFMFMLRCYLWLW